MKKKPNAELVWKQVEDLLAPASAPSTPSPPANSALPSDDNWRKGLAGDAKPVRDLMRDLESVNRGDP